MMIGYREMAERAIASGWNPTEAFDEHGRPLWTIPGQDGLVPLEVYVLLVRRELEAA